MDRKLVVVGVFAAAAALWFRVLAPEAHAQQVRFSKCVIMETVYVGVDGNPDDPKFAQRTPAIPNGWTVIGGGSVPAGASMTICR